MHTRRNKYGNQNPQCCLHPYQKAPVNGGCYHQPLILLEKQRHILLVGCIFVV